MIEVQGSVHSTDCTQSTICIPL